MSNRPEIKKWVSLLAIIGFIIFVIYLFFFTDIAEVAVIISRVSVPIYILAFACFILEAVFNSLAWKAVLDSVSVKTTFKRVFYLGWVGAFLDCLIVGGWSGDIFMTYLLGSDEGVDVVKVAASVIVKDVYELVVTILSLIIGMILLILNYSISSFIVAAIGITMLFFALPLVLIVYLSTNVSVTKRLLQFIVKLIAKIRHKKPDDGLEQKIATQISDFHEAIMIIKKKPKSMIKPMIFQTMAWVCRFIALFFVFIALGAIIGLDKIIITNTIVSTISNQGVALAGFSQIISGTLFGILGINLDMANAATLLAGFAGFWFIFVLSFVFFEVYGLGTVAEKILNKAFKKKQKKDKKDFKKQTDSNERDFEAKTDIDREAFEKLRDNNKSDYEDQRDIAKRDFEAKTDSDKSDRVEQRDVHRKDFEEKTDSDKKDFEKLRENNETDYQEQRDTNRKDFEAKTDIDREAFEKLRDNNKSDYEDQRDIAKRDFEAKTDSDKSDRVEQRDVHRKDFEEKTDSDKKDFEKLRENNETDYQEQRDTNRKDFEAKTDSDKSNYEEQKDIHKKHFKAKMNKDKKDFNSKKDPEK